MSKVIILYLAISLKGYIFIHIQKNNELKQAGYIHITQMVIFLP